MSKKNEFLKLLKMYVKDRIKIILHNATLQ